MSLFLFLGVDNQLKRIVTNNPLANDWWQKSESAYLKVTFVEGDLTALLTEARNLIHAGWKLLNHPLSSSIKPNESPFKTLVLVKTTTGLDLESLAAIEASYGAVRKLGSFPGGNPRVLADLQLIDLDLCKPLREQLWEE